VSSGENDELIGTSYSVVHGRNRHAYYVKTRNDLIGNRIVSTCRNDTIGKTQYALLCHFGAYCVISLFPRRLCIRETTYVRPWNPYTPTWCKIFVIAQKSVRG
jgi:hypothetical protein